MNRHVDQNIVNFVADFITDDSEIFDEAMEVPPKTRSPLPPPPAPPAKKPSATGVQAPVLPPPPLPPKRGSRHPLPKPRYPGSAADKAEKERQAKIEKQKAAERSGKNRSPFGDSLERALDEMMAENAGR